MIIQMKAIQLAYFLPLPFLFLTLLLPLPLALPKSPLPSQQRSSSRPSSSNLLRLLSGFTSYPWKGCKGLVQIKKHNSMGWGFYFLILGFYGCSLLSRNLGEFLNTLVKVFKLQWDREEWIFYYLVSLFKSRLGLVFEKKAILIETLEDLETFEQKLLLSSFDAYLRSSSSALL